jgi:single-strand DNA-binding protein
MSTFNHFMGIGRLTAGAELKFTASGTACLKFSICINKSYKKGDAWEEKPNFFNCVVWGKYGEAMQKHMTKGKRVGIEGELTHNPWTDNQGGKHNDVTITVSNIMLLDAPRQSEGSGSGGNSGGEPEGQKGGADGGPHDEIPF